MSRIRMDGTFKKMEKVEKDDDHQRLKFSLICIGNVKESKTRLVLSEKAQPDQKWSTTTIRNVPPDLQKKGNSIVSHLSILLLIANIK